MSSSEAIAFMRSINVDKHDDFLLHLFTGEGMMHI